MLKIIEKSETAGKYEKLKLFCLENIHKNWKEINETEQKNKMLRFFENILF